MSDIVRPYTISGSRKRAETGLGGDFSEATAPWPGSGIPWARWISLTVLVFTVFLPARADAQLSKKLVPYAGCLLGSSAKPQPPDTTYAQAMATLESKIGRPVAIAHRYHLWTDFVSSFPTDYERAWSDGGRLLLINWKAPGTWAAVASGQYDAAYVDPTAHNIAAWGRRFFFDLWHEPDNDVGAAGSGMTTSDYVDMWRHVRARFDAAGASNVVWVWNMTAWVGNRDNWNPMYPGDAYVDWLACDPYNKICAENPGTWRTFTQTFQTFRDWYATSFVGDRTKPIMIAETGCGDNSNPTPSKEQWFRSLPAELAALPQIKAFVYWNSQSDSFSPCQFYVDSTPEALSGFREACSNPYLNPALFLTSPPDFDRDGDVDQEDFGYLQACFSGSQQPVSTGCENAKLDGDSDVDQADFLIFYNCLSGPNMPVNVDCMP